MVALLGRSSSDMGSRLAAREGASSAHLQEVRPRQNPASAGKWWVVDQPQDAFANHGRWLGVAC